LREYAALAGELREHLSAAGGAGNAVADRKRYEAVVRENLLHLERLRERLEPEERARLKVPLRRARAALEGLLERAKERSVSGATPSAVRGREAAMAL